jgi:SAM-dependent methyltransferase
VSAQNVESTGAVLERAGFSNFTVEEGSLEHLPYADGRFDFVWCNGVLMHTARPSETLREIVRVLRPGGHAWVYVYGAGGTYWRIMATFRRSFAALDPSFLIKTLNEAGVPTGRVAEMLDDWKAPFLRTYEDATFARALRELGCDVQRLLRGMPYDTSEQLAQGVPPEFIGEGDLRYLVTRERDLGHLSPGVVEVLDASHLVESQATAIMSDPTLEGRLASALEAFESDCERNAGEGVLVAARAQLALRDDFLPNPCRGTLEGVLEILEERS